METELINVTIFEPDKSLFKSTRNEKAELKLSYCKMRGNCGFYENGTCINVARFLGPSCIYGNTRKVEGFTRRARKYKSWINEQKEKYKDHMYVLKSAPDVMTYVGDYIFLPYAHMTMNESIPFRAKATLISSGSPFLEKEKFTPELIVKLLTYRPMAFMGGEIKDYQKKIVPKFAKDLQILMPVMYGRVKSIYPEIDKITDSYSFVGRRAYLCSLEPGTEIKKKNEIWKWDGEYLVSANTKLLFPIVEYSDIEIRLKPKDKQAIEITDDSQVNEKTEYAD